MKYLKANKKYWYLYIDTKMPFCDIVEVKLVKISDEDTIYNKFDAFEIGSERLIHSYFDDDYYEENVLKEDNTRNNRENGFYTTKEEAEKELASRKKIINAVIKNNKTAAEDYRKDYMKCINRISYLSNLIKK